MDTRRIVNYDTQENRFVRWVFLRIEGKLKDLWKLKDQKIRGSCIGSNNEPNADGSSKVPSSTSFK